MHEKRQDCLLGMSVPLSVLATPRALELAAVGMYPEIMSRKRGVARLIPSRDPDPGSENTLPRSASCSQCGYQALVRFLSGLVRSCRDAVWKDEGGLLCGAPPMLVPLLF